MELTVQPLENIGELMVVNIGPIHPSTHGTIFIRAHLDGEVIVKAEPEVGYLHRCFEKMAETHPYHTVMPYTDRLNYCSCFMNNVGWAMTVEKLLELEVTPKCQYVRVILNEFNRIIDHLVCIAANLVDLGALTNFWYAFQPREMVYTLLEKCCGARLTVNYCQIGGLIRDIPSDFDTVCRDILKELPRFIEDIEGLITKNRIFIDRTKEINPVTAEEAIEWGWTGPCLRACGVPYDVRKAHPYYDYDKFDFEIPTGKNGDVYDRYIVRVAEMYQSMRIIEQALDGMPEGPVNVKDNRYMFPDKENVYNNIEALMHHFKFVMHGIKPPMGEVYSYTEAANGELGFYLVSDGGSHPYRVKVRPPCFAIFQSMEEMLPGHMVADLIAILGSLNLVMGELDR